MYVKAESLIINYLGEPIAHVDLRINLLGLKLKASVELHNGEVFVMKSNGEENDEFKNKVKMECYMRLDLPMN